MFKNFTIRKRIMSILIIVYVVSITAAISAGSYILTKDTIRESDEKAGILLASMKATRGYLKEVLRPKLQELHKDKFILEGMSGTYMSLGVASFVKKKHPDYIYKVVSNNPLNLDNMSNRFEEEIIGNFKRDKTEEWRGYVDRDGSRFYSIAMPVTSEPKCMKCHGDPKDTYQVLLDKYGDKTGYFYKDKDIVGGLFVYVPAKIAIAQANMKLLYFSLGFSIFFLAALIFVDRTIVHSVVKPIETFVKCAEDISRGNMNKEFEVKTNDEMRSLANAFNRMKVSLAKAMEILKK